MTVIAEYTKTTIEKASEILKQGKLVSFPTETVYGLGASALNAEACKLIYATKGRPLTDPLIVHVHSLEHGLSLIDHQDKEVVHLFKQLAARYWPGPLTMVVRANLEVIPSLVTADTGFVGIRMPNNEIALDLIRTSGLPVAAPSANKFGHVSPTKAEHVYDDFHKDSEVFIINGGSCSFGIESTVMKLTHADGMNQLLIIRRGGVSEQSLAETLRVLGIEDKTQLSAVEHKHFKQEQEKLEGPGQFLRHYSPNIDSYLFTGLSDGISKDSLADFVLLDFGGKFLELKPSFKYYQDLSPKGDHL